MPADPFDDDDGLDPDAALYTGLCCQCCRPCRVITFVDLERTRRGSACCEAVAVDLPREVDEEEAEAALERAQIAHDRANHGPLNPDGDD